MSSKIMDDVIVKLVLSLITTPTRIVYFCCLICVTSINMRWTEKGNVLERHNTLLLVAGVPWLWSNMGVGLACLVICSISLSVHGICSWAAIIESGFRDVDRDDKKDRSWNIFCRVGCLFQSIAGIAWLSSHFDLFPFVIYLIIVMSRWAGIGRGYIDSFKDSKAVHFIRLMILGIAIVSFLVTFQVLLILGRPYTAAGNFFNFFRRRICGAMLPFRSASEISIGSSSTTISTHLNNVEGTSSSFSTGSELGTTRSSWQATIGQNVNQGGTQTIGSIRIGEYVLQIQATAGRDIIFNTTMIREANSDF